MKWTQKDSLLATILYASLFEYPLTKEELVRWSVNSQTTVSVRVPRLTTIQEKDRYIVLKGEEYSISLRKKREFFSQEKWRIAKKNIRWLGIIPTVLCIGVSGGLSMNNVDEDDDIDLFIITKKDTVWISRLFVLGVLQFLGKRRRYGQRYEKDFLCPNMFVTEAQLMVPAKEQDIYSAHEVLQMVPVFVRNNSYVHFLQANQWVKEYLANAWKEKKEQVSHQSITGGLVAQFFSFILGVFEYPAKRYQLWYMQSHRTQEVISDTILRFHPQDTRQSIKKRYPELLSRYKVPLDSKFFKQLQ